MEYQIDKPFTVGQTSQVKLKGCPPDYEVEVTVKYGNVTVSPLNSTDFSVTPNDEFPMQIYARCCPPSQNA